MMHSHDYMDDELPCDICGQMTVNPGELCGDCDEMIAVFTFGLDVDEYGKERGY